MKAIVLEKKGPFAVVLREDGSFEKIRRDCQVGETIEISAEVIPLRPRRRSIYRSAAAAVLILALISSSFVYLTVPASAYVSLDTGDVSVELAVNRLGNVVSVESLGDGDEELPVDFVSDMKGRRVEDAVSGAMGYFEEQGYLSEPDDYMITGITAHSQRRSDELNHAVDRARSSMDNPDIPMYSFDVSFAERGEARMQGVSGGSYMFRQQGIQPPGGSSPENGQWAPGTQDSQFAPAPSDKSGDTGSALPTQENEKAGSDALQQTQPGANADSGSGQQTVSGDNDATQPPPEGGSAPGDVQQPPARQNEPPAPAPQAPQDSGVGEPGGSPKGQTAPAPSAQAPAAPPGAPPNDGTGPERGSAPPAG